MQNCPYETADGTQTGVEDSTLLCQDEATDHRISGYSDPDSDTLDQLDDCAAVVAFITQEAVNRLAQSSWGTTG